jgi:hypothetical protein
VTSTDGDADAIRPDPDADIPGTRRHCNRNSSHRDGRCLIIACSSR